MTNQDLEEKIKDFDQIAGITDSLRQQNKKIVHCHGVFDLVHPGHIKHFQSAKKFGDVLIVSLTADEFVKRGPGRPIFNQIIRAETLAALAVVDYVVIVNEPTAENIIKQVRPNFYAKGPDYKEKAKDVTGQISEDEKNITAIGGKLVITDDQSFSSSKLINNHLDVYSPEQRIFLRDFSQRYTAAIISDEMKKIDNLRILVIGDAIIDEYHYCQPLNKSGKEPIITNKYLSEESFAGGALATANHVGNICSNVTLLTILGRLNSRDQFIRERMHPKIKLDFFYREDAETTTKRRYISDTHNRKLFEICFFNDNPISEKIESDVALYLVTNAKSFDLIIVNDFGHGFITSNLINIICNTAKKLALNVQTNSANTGFNLITKYPHADIICIDEIELRYATHDRFSNLSNLVSQTQSTMNCDMLLATRGPKGSLSFSKNHGFTETPALATSVVDPVGAGDAFFAFAAPCYAAGLPHDMVAFIGNAVGAMAVQIVGNRETVKKIDLLKFITRLLNQ